MLKITSLFLTNAERTLKTHDNYKFLIFQGKLSFLQLRQAFNKAPVLYHFDSKYYIWIKTNIFGYAIGGILS